MKISHLRPILLPVGASGLLIGALGGIWVWQRVALDHFGFVRSQLATPLVGWLALLFVTTTLATIIWACSAQQTSGIVTSRRFLGYALLTDGCGLLLLAVGLSSGMLRLADIARVYVILTTWLGFWISVSVTLRRIGPAFAAVVSLPMSMLLFALPVTAMPLARVFAHGAAAGEGGDDRMMAILTTATPLLAVLDAVKNSFRLEWTQLPQMYHLTSIGQDIPATLPHWWATTLAYALGGAFFWLLRLPWRVDHA